MTHIERLQAIDTMVERYVYADRHHIEKHRTKGGIRFVFPDNTKYTIHYVGETFEQAQGKLF